MRLGTVFYLYRVRLRARLVQELLAVAGIAVGVALLFASQVANTSLTKSATQLTESIVGSARYQLAARDPHGFSESVMADVQSLPNVRVVVPVLQRNVNLVGPRGSASLDLIGLTPGFVRLKGQVVSGLSASRISAQQGLALPAPVGAAVGAGVLRRVVVQVGDRSQSVPVVLLLQNSDIGSLVDSDVAIAPLELAQQLSGMNGRVNRILVTPSKGRERQVESALQAIAAGRLNVLPANFEASVFRQAESPLTQSTEIFSAISALVGFLFAFNAMLLTVPQRRNLIADLRLDGYSAAEIIEVLLFDVLALAGAGILAGLAVGDLLSHSLLQAEPGYLSLAFPLGSEHIVMWQSLAIAAVGGLLAALVGIMIPLRGEIFGYAGSDSVTTLGLSLRNRAVILGVGLACLVVTSAIVIVGMSTVPEAVVALTALTLALLMIVPFAFKLAIGMMDRLQRPLSGVAPRLALIELMSGATRPRSLAIAATGAIAVYGSVAIEGSRQNLENGLDRVASEVARASDIWVAPRGTSNILPATPFADDLRPRLKELPGVRSVGVYRGGFLDIGDRRVLVMAPSRNSARLLAARQLVEGDLEKAESDLRAGGWATLSQALATQMHVRPGERFSLPTPIPSIFRLAGVTTNFGWSPGAVILNAEDYTQAWGSNDVSAYQVSVNRGASPTTVRDEIAHSLSALPSLLAETGYEREQLYRAVQRKGLARLSEIAALVLIAAALAMAAAMGAMIWQRRARIAGMKVDGFAQSELWRALLWESALLLGAGCSIGALFGLCGQLLLSRALVGVTGFPVVFGIGWAIAGGVLALVTAVAVAITALPGYLATQVKPALQD